MRWLTGMLVVLVVTGCQTVTAPTEGAISYNPDTVRVLSPGMHSTYRSLWEDVEACSGIQGDFDRVKWMVYPDHESSFTVSDGDEAAGYTEWKRHTIYFASNWTNQAFYIKHEMLHELLQRYGHPWVPFRTPCRLDEWSRDHS